MVITAGLTCIVAALVVARAVMLSQQASHEYQELSRALSTFLRIKNAHLSWTSELSHYINARNPERLSIEKDGTRCRLGNYLRDRKTNNLLQRYPVIRQELNKINLPHLELHRSALAIERAMLRKKTDQARQHFMKATLPLAHKLRNSLTKIGYLLEKEQEKLARMQDRQIRKIYAVTGVVLLLCLLVLGVVLRYAISSVNRILALGLEKEAIDQELATAQEIQKSILPCKLKDTPWYSTSVIYLPMEKIGGDYYDFFTLAENRLGVFLADISGHGISAALLASLVKMAFTSQKSNARLPAILMDELNKLLYSTLANRFITSSYAYLDLERGSLVTANAGHEPVYVLKKNVNEITTIKPKGRIIGMIPSIGYDQESFPIEPGDRVIMFTDGIAESRNADGNFFGIARLKQSIIRNRDLPPEAFSRELINEINQWSGTGDNFDDDVTLIVIDIKKKGLK